MWWRDGITAGKMAVRRWEGMESKGQMRGLDMWQAGYFGKWKRENEIRMEGRLVANSEQSQFGD